MTPEEQAPVRCAQCGRPKSSMQHEMMGVALWKYHPFIPAPEETVGLYDCEGCGASNLSSSAAYPGQHWLYDEDAGTNTLCGPLVVHAPEPAGEAEERCEDCGLDITVHYPLAAPGEGEGHPYRSTAISPGTPGLIEAERRLLAAWHGYALPDDASLDAIHEFAGEVRAPLEARIAELEHQAEVYRDTLAYAFRQVAEAGDAEEDAERKLEEMREALARARDAVVLMASKSRVLSRNIDNFPASYEISVDAYEALYEVHYAAERALTPPASTAQGDEDAR